MRNLITSKYFTSNKAKATLLSITLVLIVTVSLTVIPTASAHDPPWQIPTWTYIAATNNPIGVNQDLVLVFWLNAVPITHQGQYGDLWSFNIEVTKPDGTKATEGPFTSDPVGGSYYVYKPQQAGKYVFVAKFLGKTIDGLPLDPRLPPERAYNRAYWGDVYQASQSNPLTITVQQEPIEQWPEVALPNRYWTRPVNDANRGWYELLGNWLSGAAQSVGATTNYVFGDGPESAHVLWATPMWSGGYMDQRFGDTGFQTGHYEGLQFNPPIIMDGRIFYNINTYPKQGWNCLSLYTGELLYFHNTTGPVVGTGGGFNSAGNIGGESLSFGQIYNYGSPNQHGGFDYLWSMNQPGSPSTWMMFDGFTGNYICSISNVTQTEMRGSRRITTGGTGTAVYGLDGSILRYNIVNLGGATPAYYLQVWNTSQAIMYPAYTNPGVANAYWMWRPTLNKTFDGRDGFSLNASIPTVTGNIRAVREGNLIIGGVPGKANDTYTEQGHLWALNLDPSKGAVGSLLWNITFTPPKNVPDAAAGSGFGAAGVAMSTVDVENGIFLFNNRITLEWYGYSLSTGQQIWKSEPEGDFNFYGMYSNIYEGKLLSTGYSGVLMAYDIKTGAVLWNYTAPQIGYESPYGNYPMYITAIADDKIYVVSGEHSPTQPLWRGSYIRCIDANTGEEVWKVLHWGSGIGGAHLTGTAVYLADGIVVGLNLYDNQIYAYGKGPSATTVDVKNDVVSQGNSVLITGTVLDISPGAKNKIGKGEFTSLAAISDEDQEAYMEYVYAMQNEPKDAKGVPVSLDIIDPNNNSFHISDVVSDSSGGFKYLWTPEIQGEYTVIATFDGSKAYYASSARTYVGVVAPEAAPITSPTVAPTQSTAPTQTAVPTQAESPSPSPSPVPEPKVGTPTTTYIAIGAAVIIIVAAAAALILRRRK